MSRGCLRLNHDYPKDTEVTAEVDVNLLLETLGHEQTRIGEWLNVIGYVMSTSRTKNTSKNTRTVVYIQAVLVWPTGPLDVGKYEAMVDKQLT